MKIQFSMESPLWRFFELVTDIFETNIYFVLTSIPVITMGASISAMNTVFFKRREKRLGNLRKEYFKAFKSCFKQSTIIWFFYLIFVAACVLNINSNVQVAFVSHKTVIIVFGVFLMLISMTVLYALAMTARFDNDLTGTLMKSFIIGCANFPYAFTMIVMITAAALMTFRSYRAILVAVIIWILIGFGILGYISSILFLRSFRKFTRTEEIPEDAVDEIEYQARLEEKAARKARKQKRKNNIQ